MTEGRKRSVEHLAALAITLASAASCTLPSREVPSEACHPWDRSEPCFGGRRWSPRTLQLPGGGYIELAAAVSPGASSPRFGLATVRATDGQTAHIVAETWRPGEVSDLWSPTAGLEGFHEQPSTCFTSDGALLLTHHTATQAEGGGRVYASFRGSDGSVVVPRLLSNPPNAATTTVATSQAGDATLVWAQTLEDGRIGVSVAHRDSGALTWSVAEGATSSISIPVLFANDPRVVMNGRGDTLVSWYQSTGDTPLRVYASLRPASQAAFVTPTPDDTLSSSYDGPEGLDGLFLQDARPALGEEGQAAVFWTQPNGEGASALFFAEARVGQGDWTRPTSNADAFTPFDGVASDPVVQFGRDGHLFVAWRRTVSSSQRVELAVRDPSGTWVVSGRAPLLLAEAPVLGAPAMTVVDGRALVAWQVARRVVRTTFVDAAQPFAFEVEDRNEPNESTVGDPVLSSNARGNALVAWTRDDVVRAATWNSPADGSP